MTDTGDVVEARLEGYERDMNQRRRSLAREFRLRYFALQATWVIVLTAGAAIPLSAALGWPGWVAPVLGFSVVVATGLEKVFNRTTDGAVAVDRLRRALEQEGRLFRARRLHYADIDDPFDEYVCRSEAAIADFDRSMLAYAQQIAPTSKS